MSKFAIVIRAYPAPRSGRGKYRRAKRILIVDATNGIKPMYRTGDKTVIQEWANVDSRYDGPKSAYGMAIREAHSLCVRLNESTALAECT